MTTTDTALVNKFETNKPIHITDTTWFFATNHVNLLRILAASLLLSPKGFEDNYFADSLKNFPGWIPLFADKIPKSVIENSLSEADYLLPCVAEIKLNTLRGRVAAVCVNGTCCEVEFPDDLTGNEIAILVPAPLPTTWIEKIIFRSKVEQKKCEALANNCSNVPIGNFKKAVSAKIFSKAPMLDWPPNANLENLDTPPDRVLAIGGMMAHLYQIANKGLSATSACRAAFKCGERTEAIEAEGLFETSLNAWLKNPEDHQSDDIALTLYWEIVNQIIDFKSNPIAGRNFMDIVLDYLDLKKGSLGKSLQEHLNKLIDDLRALSGFSDSTISDLLKRHPKYFSRSLILFFLRDKCSELLELRVPGLNESDFLAAAVLFSARDGWINLPLRFRSYSGMEEAISHRMALLAHRYSASGLDLGPMPPRSIPLREFFYSKDKGWTNKQKNIALKLAQVYKWDCIHTKINLGKGEYNLVIDGSGVHIFLPGEVKAVITEVDSDLFMEELATTIIPYDIENRIRSTSTKG